MVTSPRPASRPYLPYIVLCIALVTAASGMITVRMAQNEGIQTPAIIAMRLMMATLLLTTFAARRHATTIRRLERRDWLLMALAGSLFAADSTLFLEAMKHAGILLTAVIGSLLPLWTALLERLILKTPLRRSVYMGLALALAGGAVIAFSGSEGTSLGPNPLLGVILALGSGFSAALYLIIARSLRSHIALIPYIWVVFAFAGMTALAATFITGGTLTGHSSEGYLWVLAATVVSQLIAHPGFNFVLGYLSPTFVSISSQSIVVFASVFAFVLFHEVPGIGQIIGSAIILTGIVFAIKGQPQPSS